MGKGKSILTCDRLENVCRIGAILKIFVIACFVLLLWAGCASAATLVVNQTSPACTIGDIYCDTIQEAVDMAEEGDTIVVCEGIYHENVVIDKPLIVKASGNVTIESFDDSNFTVWIKANNVVFSGFNVKGGYIGIRLSNVHGCRIENNSVVENDFGIALISSSGNSIVNNSAVKNEDNGIHFQDSSNNNKIENNTACENGDRGIYLADSSGNDVYNNIVNKNLYGFLLIRANKNKIENNTACENGNRGINLADSSGNEVYNNIVNKNLNGILLIRANKNKIENNTACENGDEGIKLQDSSGNEVYNNIVNKNLDGFVLMLGSNNNKITNNTACENEDMGINLLDSSGNEVYNNIVNKNLDGFVLIRANNNKIGNNTACENEDEGIHLYDSSGNDVYDNIVNKNLYGFVLFSANNTKIGNNTACENGDDGIHLYDSSGNDVYNNIVNKNLKGIILIRANNNKITKNDIVENKDQVVIQDKSYNRFNYNYWSDYKGKDENNDGIGDKPYVIKGISQEDDYDYHPYMNYSGWLKVVVLPEYWYFFAKKGDVINKTFSIENRLDKTTDVKVLLDENLGFEADPNYEENSNKTFSIYPKSPKNITLQLNTTNLEGYILRKIIFNTEEYTKTTMVNGFVQPKIHTVKVEGVDFHRNVVHGQINPFKIFLKNYGDKDEFEVKLRMRSEEINSTVYLNETENKTISFEIDTSNLPLGINKGQVVVSKDRRLDYLNLTMFVASKLEASTLIVTNLSRFNESEELRNELIRLTHHPAVNGILLDVTCNYSEFDSNYSKANELCEGIKKQIEDKISNYTNVKYLIIVGDDSVIPFYRVSDGTNEVFTYKGLYDEDHYYYKDYKPGVSSSIDDALSTNHFLTDDFYANLSEGRVLAVGRLLENPDEIIAAIDMFFNYYQLTPKNVFVTGCEFMYDGSEVCFEEWSRSKRINTTFKLNPDEIKSEISNSSISAIFLHADYYYFCKYEDKPLLKADEIKDLDGSIIYTMSCHAGLTVPEVRDLAQSFLSHGTIAYIAPTGYGLGGVITIAGHEKLLEYLTKRIKQGEEVGFALMNAKNDYYLDNFHLDKLDEKVIKSLTLYGFPMYAVRLDSSIAAMGEDMKLEEHSIKEFAITSSNITLEHAILTLKPRFRIHEIGNRTYYTYEGYTTEAGMPILPKATWYFCRGEKEIRGIVLRSAKYEVKGGRLAVETFAVSGANGNENELKNWYPSIPFTLNTIEDRQSVVIASAQYKGEEWWGTIRLFNETVLDIFRVPKDAEKEKPVVNVSVDRNVTIKVEDKAGIYDVLVTYQDLENNSWESKSLGKSDRRRTSVEYCVELNNTAFFVQAVDVNGNVEIDDNAGRYYYKNKGGPEPS